MLRLILFRHGKAVPHENGPDFERGLTHRGVQNSAQMATDLQNSGVLPDYALVSSARRTLETWEAMRSQFPDTNVKITRDLYLAPSDAVFEAIHEIRSEDRTALIIGHNPALHDLALKLVGFGDRYALARLKDHLPTAGLVVLDFDVDAWTEISARSGRLDRFLTPDNSDHD